MLIRNCIQIFYISAQRCMMPLFHLPAIPLCRSHNSKDLGEEAILVGTNLNHYYISLSRSPCYPFSILFRIWFIVTFDFFLLSDEIVKKNKTIKIKKTQSNEITTLLMISMHYIIHFLVSSIHFMLSSTTFIYHY